MADRQLQAGDAERALAVAEKVMRFDPCSEHAAQLVMSACWTAGDSDGLRHAWRRIEDALARGIDGRPSVETAELHRHLSGRPRPPVPPAAPPRRLTVRPPPTIGTPPLSASRWQYM